MAVSCIISKILAENRYFLYPLHPMPRSGVPVEILSYHFIQKTRIVWLPDRVKSLMICVAILIEYQRVTA